METGFSPDTITMLEKMGTVAASDGRNNGKALGF
jgi:hypothetical protein